MRRILLLAALLLIPTNCMATDSDGEWVRQSLLSSCKFWNSCSQYFRHHHRQREIERRYYGNEEYRARYEYDRDRHDAYREPEYRDIHYREREGYKCLDTTVDAVGAQGTTVDTATVAGSKAWSAKTQWLYGGQFMNIEIAAKYRSNCGPTDPGDSTTSKVASGVNTALEYVPGTPQRRAKKEGDEVEPTRCQIIAIPCRKPLEWRDRNDRERGRR